MTAIIDYGVGNLFSLLSSFEAVGEKAVVTGDADTILHADRIVLPGVGAFADAMQKLRESGLVPVIKKAVDEGIPTLGICLGMQLLFDTSYEYGRHEGLGLIPGKVMPIDCPGLKVPHMGWNALEIKKNHPLFKYTKEGEHVYFVHSYRATECDADTVATAEYGTSVTAAVAKGSLMGCQFHPEKSGSVGLAILRAFCEMKAGAVC